jgi:hypothetical protein
MASDIDYVLFPSNKSLMCAPHTFRFFMRVLTEIHEAQQEVEKYLTSKQNQSDENSKKIQVQIAQMQADLKLFTESTDLDTVLKYKIKKNVDTTTSRQYVFHCFLDHMNDEFQKVHGIEYKNAIDQLQNDPLKKVWQNYYAVTGFMPTQRLPSDHDNLREFLNNLTRAGNQVEKRFHQKKILLYSANPYIVTFL